MRETERQGNWLSPVYYQDRSNPTYYYAQYVRLVARNVAIAARIQLVSSSLAKLTLLATA